MGKLRYGIGFNWYDGFQKDNDSEGNPAHPDLADKAGWAAVYQALDDLRPGIIRFGLPPDTLVGEKPGQINTHDVYLEKLARIAGWAEKNGCTVLLDPFSVPKKFQFPTGPREQVLKKTEPYLDMAARDNDAYARDFIVPFLRNVLVERNLRAVKLFNAYNEPLMYGRSPRPIIIPTPLSIT